MLGRRAMAPTLGVASWSGGMGIGARADSPDCWGDGGVGMVGRWNSI